MKKSVMLELMAKRIKDINFYGSSEMEVATELLEEMEHAGMLPPTIIDTSLQEIFTNRWEDEEKKG